MANEETPDKQGPAGADDETQPPPRPLPPYRRERVFVQPEDFLGPDGNVSIEPWDGVSPDESSWDAGETVLMAAYSRPAYQESAADHVTRYLSADSPTRVVVGERFNVTARIGSTHSAGAETVRLPPVPAAGLPIQFRVKPRSDHVRQVDDEVEKTVVVLPNGDTATTGFAFQAMRDGVAQLDICAYLRGRFLGQVEAVISIDALARIDAPDRQALKLDFEEMLDGERVATLEIAFNPYSLAYDFVFRGPDDVGIWAGFHSARLNPEWQNEILGLIKRINDDVKFGARDSDAKDSSRRALMAFGSQLWNTLIPRDLKQCLETHADRFDHLTLLCRDDIVPWELLYADDPGSELNGFMADQRWSLSRWRYGPGARRQIGLGPARFVVPDNAPAQAMQEIARLSKIYPNSNRPVIKTRADLLTLLEDGSDLGLLHMAAHNCASTGEPMGGYLVLDREFRQTDMGPQTRKRLARGRPLVFLNACSSAAPTTLWTGSTSWASLFLEAGAGAFIGSLWLVRDETAHQFANAFHEAAKAGATLGRALQRARKEACNDPSDPTRFAYTLFGDPQAKLGNIA